jgi:hypothetical protein
MKRNSLVPLMVTLNLLGQGCTLDSPVGSDYYAGTDKLAGGKAPSAPVVTLTVSELRVDFTAAIDPESGSEVATYFVYRYSGMPGSYYSYRDIEIALDAKASRRYYLKNDRSGQQTVIVTGYDGYRESAVTDQNRIVFTYP